jgi:hypothetical protein
MKTTVFWDVAPCSLVEVGFEVLTAVSTKMAVLAEWFLYLKPIPRVRLTHRPDDGVSKDL